MLTCHVILRPERIVSFFYVILRPERIVSFFFTSSCAPSPVTWGRRINSTRGCRISPVRIIEVTTSVFSFAAVNRLHISYLMFNIHVFRKRLKAAPENSCLRSFIVMQT